jgi:hypothetical protein
MIQELVGMLVLRAVDPKEASEAEISLPRLFFVIIIRIIIRKSHDGSANSDSALHSPPPSQVLNTDESRNQTAGIKNR